MLQWTRRLAALRRSDKAARVLVVVLLHVFAGAALSPLTARAYTVLQTGTSAPIRWHASSVKLRIDPALEAYFGDLRLRSLVSEAAAAWLGLDGVPELLINDGPPRPLGYDERYGTSNGVYLVEDWQLQESALAVTVTTFRTESGRVLDTDILVNANYPFERVPAQCDGPAQAYDLLGVMTHEMGHVLGLGESYDAPLATMWPSFGAGETHQRDLDRDDQEGAEQAYAGAALNEQVMGVGCGGASIAGPRVTDAAWCLFGIGAVLLGARAWRRPRKATCRASFAFIFGCALLFGAPLQSASRVAADSHAPDAARMGRLHRDHPGAKGRLASFLGHAPRLVTGRAEQVGVRMRAGIIWSRFRVRDRDSSAVLEIAGGSLHGLTQVVSEQTIPVDGDVLVVALRERGPYAWAHHRDGAVYGGSLGEGPAIEWQP
jgi:hypothetical protein